MVLLHERMEKVPPRKSFEQSAYRAIERQVSESWPLKDHEFVEIWKEWKLTGKQYLFDQLMISNLRMVFKIANQISKTTNLEVTQGYQAGCIALAKAIPKFQPDKTKKFANFAWTPVEQGILAEWRTSQSIVFHPKSETNWKKLEEARGELKEELSRLPSSSELAKRLGWKVEVVERLEYVFNAGRKPTSLEAREKSGQGLVGDHVASPEGSPWNISTELAEKIVEVTSGLTPREKTIFCGRYLRPLFGQKPLKDTELAPHFGVTKERVRQLGEKLKERLKLKCFHVFGVRI